MPKDNGRKEAEGDSLSDDVGQALVPLQPLAPRDGASVGAAKAAGAAQLAKAAVGAAKTLAAAAKAPAGAKTAAIDAVGKSAVGKGSPERIGMDDHTAATP